MTIADKDSPSEEPTVVVPTFTGTPVITTTKLNGRNYSQWSFAVKLWFRGQGLVHYLTEDVPKLSKANLRLWDQVDAQLTSLLLQSIEPELHYLVQGCPSCKVLWNRTMNMYSSTISRIYDVTSDLLRIQLDERGLAVYFGRFQSAMAEYNEIFPPDTDTYRQHREQFFVVLMLRGLPSQFDPVRSQILSSATLPSMTDVFAALNRASLTSTVLSPDNQSALFTQNPNRDLGITWGNGCYLSQSFMQPRFLVLYTQ
ncbi:hypothetical protein DH2020_027304 [Rehmannia glutinosa]|uniref:Retrotransposon Copia-like N-terminal domain-containing protein n=1 Tax=Rehmannia glutinosa TaxID=99300 RepID=A0ABR0VUK8_REHGL